MSFHCRDLKFSVIFLLSFVASFLSAAAFGDPRGFLENQQVSETIIYVGVKYIRADGSHLGKPMVTHVVTVDMTNPGVKLQMLPGEQLVTESAGQFFRRSTVSQLQQDNNALVAINSAFFDIGATMTPGGLHVRDGMLLRQPESGRPSFAVTREGLAFIDSFSWNKNVRNGNLSHSLHGVNANSIGDNNIGLYYYPWDRSPGTNAGFIAGRAITEVILEKESFTKSQSASTRHVLRGKVLEVRNNRGSVTLNPNTFALTATGTRRANLQQMTVGSTISLDWSLTGAPSGVNWSRIDEVVSGNNLLIVDGVLQEGSGSHWDSLHPRSAVGINQSQTKVMFVLVEGRQSGRADGMSLTSLRNYMSHMGAFNALEMDGGGSSALAGRVNGNDGLLSTPSGGVERYVPTGLGVVAVPEPAHPFFQNVRVSTGHDIAVVSWETSEPAVSYLLYGEGDYDTESLRNLQPSTNHTVYLSGLEPYKLYFARMMADTTGGTQTSQGLQITTGVELIMDDTMATFQGSWSNSTVGTPYGQGFRSTDVVIANNPTATATFRPNLPMSGLYDLYEWHTPVGAFTSAARYEVKHQAGTQVFTRTQQSGGKQWTLLAGNLSFEMGTNSYARVRNDSTVGSFVMADAFRWVLRNPAPLPPGEAPAWWREHFFGPTAPDSSADPDGDGYSLHEEYIWGTIPNDSVSSPRAQFDLMPGGDFRLTFGPVRADREYRIESSTDLETWATFEVSIHETDGEGAVVLPVETGAGRRYYRLRVTIR